MPNPNSGLLQSLNDIQYAFAQYVVRRDDIGHANVKACIEKARELVAESPAPIASAEEAVDDDARNLVTLDRRDLWDCVRGAIYAALNDKIPKNCVVSWAWEEATNRTMDIFQKIVDTHPAAAQPSRAQVLQQAAQWQWRWIGDADDAWRNSTQAECERIAGFAPEKQHWEVRTLYIHPAAARSQGQP
ncbi:hypothetical protein P3T24_004347 [Paraburkholderia sp. GAS33]|uniref:hypothetical protein n=1 Tax=Paraburkholderia sp. GAS33 TaxID=3035130 RepID=UPI003D23548A